MKSWCGKPEGPDIVASGVVGPEVSCDLNLDIVDVGAAQELVQDSVTVVGIARAARAARAGAERQVATIW